MPNPVTWFEIIGGDPTKLQKFYADTFGWTLSPPDPNMGNYSMMDHEGKGIQGGIGGDPSDHSRVTIYIEVDDPQAYVDKVAKAGCKILMPVTKVTDGVVIAMFSDPAGNTMGLLKAN